ncbi:MAG: hypothetical protein LBV32_01190 [Tannerellaceae bacterium]|jgi:hypothetical protein|nr:hypothetical protein [Tannerellaceae bacterium]
MKERLFYLFFIMLASCNSQNSEVERVNVNPEIILNDLETMMPGGLELTRDYLLWTDPFTIENYVHIVDRKTGLETAQAVSVGQGPEELVQPSLSVYRDRDNSFFVYNANSKKQFKVEITENGLSQEKVLLDYGEGATITRMLPLNGGRYLTFNPEKSNPFTVLGDNDSYSFGKLPHESDITNRYDVFQGTVKYNPAKEVLVYATFSFPYISLYKRKNGKFEMEKEVLFSTDFQIIDGSLKGNTSKKNISEIAFTRDYIVTLQRDYSTDNTDEQTVGRNFDKLPQTIFLYDYDLELKRIVHLGMPVLRLTGDPADNTVYAIGLSPDFVIVKLEI